MNLPLPYSHLYSYKGHSGLSSSGYMTAAGPSLEIFKLIRKESIPFGYRIDDM
jgi:hypothetical protein